MKFDAIDTIIHGISLLVRPIVRLALRNGVTYRQFSELSKKLYVDVAATDYGVSGRQTNASRIALMTGINRKDIKKLNDERENGSANYDHGSPDRIARILSAWHTHPDYLSANGQPLELPIESCPEEGAKSFHTLVAQYGGDIAPITLIREFKRSGVIKECESGSLRVLKRHFIPNPFSDPERAPETIDPKPLLHASSILNDHVTTIYHNLYRDQHALPPRFERRVTSGNVDPDAIAEFESYIAAKGQELLEEIDDWLNKHQLNDTETNTRSVRLGFGTYWIQDEKK